MHKLPIGLGVALFLSWPIAALAQEASPNCPPPLTPPTQEHMQKLAREAQDHGFMWKIEKDGRVSHLYGTMHSNQEAWLIPGPKTMAALKDSEVVAMEIDVLDPAVQAAMGNPAQFGIKKIALPDATRKRIETIARRVCAPVAAMADMHPIMQLAMLALFDARFMGFEAAYGTEFMLSGFARAGQKKVVSLESAELQMKALLGGDEKEVLAQIDAALAQFNDGKQRSILSKLVNTWGNGDLAGLQDYEKWCECALTPEERAAFKRLNDDRNPGLAAGIDKLHAGGAKVFAAVGALHMVGPQGLPKLMTDKGYKVERVNFTLARPQPPAAEKK